MSTAIHTDESLHWLSKILLNRARPIGHAAFWISVLLFYTFYFGARQDELGQSLIFVGLLLPITILTTYFLLYWLIPRYLLTQRYFFFGLYFGYTLLLSLYLELMLVLLLYINVSGYQAMFVKPGLVDLLDVIVGMYLVVFLATALHLLKRWFSMQSINTRLKTEGMETALKLKDAELQLLKSQIHPHFLFNTLNNLYGLALEKSEHVPDVVLKISALLDYMLYRSDNQQVSVEDEIKHIQNYLALEALRYGERLNVSVEVSGPIEQVFIAPLLLIPFAENSIKHGTSHSTNAVWIKIKLTAEANRVTFEICNNKYPEASDTPPGIGLNNVRRRLQLLYPQRHALEIQDAQNIFQVKLILQLDAKK